MGKYVKASSEGKLYIETKDIFKQPKIIATIMKLKESKLVKEMKRDLTTI